MSTYLHMTFGLKNSPITFQRVMDDVLKNLKYKIYFVFIDDVIVLVSSFQDRKS